MRVLLVEDHDRLASFIQEGLTQSQIDVDRAATVEAAEASLAAHNFDAMLLDIGLPDGDGFDILKRIRASGNGIPVIIITSRIQVADRVLGLNAGADDYLTKPFAMEELVARILAVLRRPKDVFDQILRCGNISFDVSSREVRAGESFVSLSPKEMKILEHLIRRESKVTPKASLEESLYGLEGDISSNSVEVLVHRLRKKLAAVPAGVSVHTVHGVGYMLMPDATEDASPSTPN